MMSLSWKSKISLGIVHPMIYPKSRINVEKSYLLKTLKMLATDVFFDVVDITSYQTIDTSTRAEIRDLLKSSGIEVVYNGCIPIVDKGLNLNSEDEEIRKNSIKQVKELIDEAYFYNARILYIASGCDTSVENREKAKDKLIDSIKALCDYSYNKADTYSLCLALENLDRTVQLKRLIGPTKEAVEIARAVSSEYDNFGLVIDTSHLPLLNETFQEAISLAAEYIVQIHFANCINVKTHPYYGDRHPRFCIKDGEYNIMSVKEFLKNLEEAGYFKKSTPLTLPLISLETKPMENEESEILLANEKRVFQNAWVQYQTEVDLLK